MPLEDGLGSSCGSGTGPAMDQENSPTMTNQIEQKGMKLRRKRVCMTNARVWVKTALN